MGKIVTVGVAALVLLAGCSSNKPAKQQASPVVKSSSASSSPSPSPTATYASVAQWGSLIATLETPVLQSDGQMAGCKLSALDPDCGLPALGFQFTVQTFVIKLGEQMKPAGLGSPPPEIADLVNQTLAAGNAVNDASTAQEKCVGSTTSACVQTDLAWDDAHDALVATLNGWKPYTGG